MRRVRAAGVRGVLALVVVTGVLWSASGAAWAGSGVLSQLAGSGGCVHDVANNRTGDGCSTARELGGPAAAVISPDGKDLYSIGYTNESGALITAFARAGDGSLSQLAGAAGCLGAGVTGCRSVRGLEPSTASAIAISPDGRDVYASAGGSAVVVLQRDSHGSLSQLGGAAGCVSQDGTDGHGGVCGTTRSGIDFQALWIVVSPDGRTVYAGSTTGATIVAVFVRNADGSLSVPAGAAGCVSSDGTDYVGGICATSPAGAPSSAGMAISRDGRFAYVISSYTDSIDGYARDPKTGALTGLGCVVDADAAGATPGCTPGRELQSPHDVALSPDGTSLYVASGNGTNNGVAVFSRNPLTGSIAQAGTARGCLSLTGQDGETKTGPCTRALGLFGVASIAAAPDGQSVYTAGVNNDLAVFDRAGDGTLTQPARPAGCHGADPNTDGCTPDRALDGAEQVLLSADGRNAYLVESTALLAFVRGTPAPPVFGKSVDVKPVSGIVLVKLPVSARSAAARGHSAVSSVVKGNSFVPLTQARQIPVGSVLDTTRGVVSLTSATRVGHRTQTGDFQSGLFKVLQRRAERGLTELGLIDNPGVCTRTGKARIARNLPNRVLDTLRGNAKGSFRTRGRYSSATVRGTKWDVIDRCDGTLTRVHRGVVVVRDFRRRINITVHAGKSYLARAA